MYPWQNIKLFEKIIAENGLVLTLETIGSLILRELDPNAAGFLKAQTIYESKPAVITSDNNVFPVIDLPDTEIKLRLERLNTDPHTLTGRWYIVLTANPSPALTTLLPTLELIGEPTLIELFGLSDEEPYLTFKNLWFDHPLPAYRLAGLVMAFIYRTEQLRTRTNG